MKLSVAIIALLGLIGSNQAVKLSANAQRRHHHHHYYDDDYLMSGEEPAAAAPEKTMASDPKLGQKQAEEAWQKQEADKKTDIAKSTAAGEEAMRNAEFGQNKLEAKILSQNPPIKKEDPKKEPVDDNQKEGAAAAKEANEVLKDAANAEAVATGRVLPKPAVDHTLGNGGEWTANMPESIQNGGSGRNHWEAIAKRKDEQAGKIPIEEGAKKKEDDTVEPKHDEKKEEVKAPEASAKPEAAAAKADEAASAAKPEEKAAAASDAPADKEAAEIEAELEMEEAGDSDDEEMDDSDLEDDDE